MIAPNVTETQVPMMGVPGEVQNLVIFNIRKGQDPSYPLTQPWKSGKYRVQLLLGRPGFPDNPEYKHSFIDGFLGNSHLRILKPKAQRKLEDADHMIWWAAHRDKAGKMTQVQFKGEANDQGFLGKFTAIIDAVDANEAAAIAYAALAPLLSALSTPMDIPLHIETIQVTEVETGNTSLRIIAPFQEKNFLAGQIPFMSEEFCHYASVYREALQSNSPFYRFLCLFKIIEALQKRRARLAIEAKLKGMEPARPAIQERVPSSKDERITLLRAIFAPQITFDEMFIDQTFPAESHGKSFQQLRTSVLEEIRNSIAHALWGAGEVVVSLDNMEDLWKVNKWLPLLRCFARLMLMNAFPVEFLKSAPIALPATLTA